MSSLICEVKGLHWRVWIPSFFIFKDRVSLSSPGWPGTHRNLPASAFRVTRFKVCARHTGSRFLSALDFGGSHLGIQSKDTSWFHRDTFSTILNVSLFITTRNWKQPRWPSRDEWIKNNVVQCDFTEVWTVGFHGSVNSGISRKCEQWDFTKVWTVGFHRSVNSGISQKCEQWDFYAVIRKRWNDDICRKMGAIGSHYVK